MGELAQPEQLLHAEQEAGAADAADQNGDLHTDTTLAVGPARCGAMRRIVRCVTDTPKSTATAPKFGHEMI